MACKLRSDKCNFIHVAKIYTLNVLRKRLFPTILLVGSIRFHAPEKCSGCDFYETVKWLILLINKDMAGEPGFEPGLTESESVGLPLTYSPAGHRLRCLPAFPTGLL